ncbi:MAG: flavin reductase family protein [Emcibacter sp.]|nr:flavin reductase family protein [Emcibacter sp.]
MNDSVNFRKVLGNYPTGVCVVTSTEEDGKPVGMSVGTFTSVSLDPPLVAFLPDRRSSTWQKIHQTGRFCVNVLGDHQEAISRQFATPAVDKFIGIPHRLSDMGSPIFDGVVAWIDCEVEAVHEAGDHYIAIGKVVALGAEDPAQPLLYHKGIYSQVSPIPMLNVSSG